KPPRSLKASPATTPIRASSRSRTPRRCSSRSPLSRTGSAGLCLALPGLRADDAPAPGELAIMSKLILRGVSKAYGATMALSHGDLALEAGEVHVLIGSNGSGKSTLCKIAAGSVRPDAGEMLIDGAPV